jgi:beta-lactamase class A
MQRRTFLIAAVAAAGACAEQGRGQPAMGRPQALFDLVSKRVPNRPDIGWAASSLRAGWVLGQNTGRAYQMQSVFKLWLAAALLADVDAGRRRLDDPVTVTMADLGYPYQPIAEKVGEGGYGATLLELIRYIVILSDNPSAEVLLNLYGGAAKLTAWLKSKGVEGVRIDGGERFLHARAAEIDAAAGPRQNELVDAFVGGTLDGSTPNSATPAGAVDALARLHRGQLLSAESTRLLLGAMAETATGEAQLKAALEPGWALAHKTGNGGHANGQTRTLGLNDIGFLTAPDGAVFAVAVFVAGAAEPRATQDAWIADVARGVIAQWKADRAAASD